jgi:hypothetical protein
MAVVCFHLPLDSSDCRRNWKHKGLITLCRIGSGLLCTQRSSDIPEVVHGVSLPPPVFKSMFCSSSGVSVRSCSVSSWQDVAPVLPMNSSIRPV